MVEKRRLKSAQLVLNQLFLSLSEYFCLFFIDILNFWTNLCILCLFLIWYTSKLTECEDTSKLLTFSLSKLSIFPTVLIFVFWKRFFNAFVVYNKFFVPVSFMLSYVFVFIFKWITPLRNFYFTRKLTLTEMKWLSPVQILFLSNNWPEMKRMSHFKTFFKKTELEMNRFIPMSH